MDFFTADLHLNHGNIIKYCNRPFDNADAMNKTIINNWNNKVSANDTVYVLGDFCFYGDIVNIAKTLNGKKILIKGNHDYKQSKRNLLEAFESVHDLYTYRYNGNKFTLCHYAMRVWPSSHYGTRHLFGHSHGALKEVTPGSMDVGVDCHNFTPLSIDEVVAALDAKWGPPKNIYKRGEDS